MAAAGVKAAPLTPDIAIASSHLPGGPQGDAAEGLPIATARHPHAPIVTRDRKIMAYSRQGHVRAIAC